MQNKFAWIVTPDLPWDDRKEMITTALESGINYVVDLEYSDKIRKLGNVNIISNNEDADIYLVYLRSEAAGEDRRKEKENGKENSQNTNT